MKRRKNKKSAASIIPWKYEEAMSFLRPYMKSRPLTTNAMSLLESTASQSASYPSTPSSSTSHSQRRVPKKRNLQDLFDLMRSSSDLRLQKQQSKQHDMDETDLFFLSMSKAVKELPKLDQTKIKLDLHTAISQAEIRKLQAQVHFSPILETLIKDEDDSSE